MTNVAQQRADQRHKWAIIVSIKREAGKNRPPRERKTKRERCRPRYNLLGEQS